jgi:hypothetical protein
MSDELDSLLANFQRAATGVSLDAIRTVEQRLTTIFPPDYVAFMRESDGGEGDVGTEGYIQLWPIGALVERPKATSPVSCSWVRTAAMKALGLRSGANGSSYS